MSGNIAVISDPVLGTLAAAGIGAGFALSTYTRVRASLIAGLMASLVWAIYVLVARLELENSVSVAIAAAAAGALGVLGHSRLRVPEQAMTTAAIVALLPGLAVYRGLYLLIDQPTGRVGPGLSELVAAMGIGMGLAAGVSAGGYVARRKLGLTLVLPRGRRRPAA
ncbi:MAG: threonine/serine exporter family protein [Nocardioides sp.]